MATVAHVSWSSVGRGREVRWLDEYIEDERTGDRFVPPVPEELGFIVAADGSEILEVLGQRKLYESFDKRARLGGGRRPLMQKRLEGLVASRWQVLFGAWPNACKIESKTSASLAPQRIFP